MTPQIRQITPFSGPPFLHTAVGRIIAVTVGVFFLQQIFPAVNMYLTLTPRLAVEHFQVWQFVTYMFLHGGFGHLFFNLLVLWFIGTMVETAWGPTRFLRYYIICGIGGGLLHALLQYNASVIGASGAIFGVYFAAAMLFPISMSTSISDPGEDEAPRDGLTILQLASGSLDRRGLLFRAPGRHDRGCHHVLRGDSPARPVPRGRGGAGRPTRASVAVRMKKRTENNIDSILDKISAKGYETLTPTEKRILENYSKQGNDKSE
jgi:hypothetical protein